MTILDVFNTDAFSALELTAAINIVPNRYGRLNELNLFPAAPVRTRTVAVEFNNGVLNLLPFRAVGAPGTTAQREKRNMRTFTVPHIPHDDSLMAEEIQGVRAFGSEDMLQAVADEVNKRLASMRAKHAITLEYLRMGALKGTIVDADGATYLNLFTEFGVTQKSVDFVLGTSSTNVDSKIREVMRHIEDNLEGEVHTGVHALVDESFFDKLVTHANVKEAYKYYSSTQEPLRQDVRRRFFYAGMTFEEYRGTATDLDANGTATARKFIATDEGHAFPLGTVDTFATHFAPADFLEAVNTPGVEVYAKQAEMRFARGIDLHTQSNPLPICRRPKVLVKVHTSN